MELEIRALTPELAADYFDFFENRAFTDDSPYRCYCQMYQMTKVQAALYDGAQPGDFGRISREIAQTQILSGALQGYLAYAGNVAIGWINANDKACFPEDSRDGARFHAPVHKREKAVVCFEIAPEFRGRGVATALLARVLADARKQGFLAVEGFPIVRQERFEWDCAGPVRLYEKLGFVKTAEMEDRLVMRKAFDAEA